MTKTDQRSVSDLLIPGRKPRPGRTIALVVGAVVVIAALVVGGFFVRNAVIAHNDQVAAQKAHTLLITEQKQVAEKALDAKMEAAAAAAVKQSKADDAAAYAAQQAAAAAQAAADAATQAAKPKAPSSSSTGNPAGTPIPEFKVTDPNAGNYGQMQIIDPNPFCASGSGSTINGVPVCD